VEVCSCSSFFFKVSPADGEIAHLGKLDENHRIEHVKGVSYSKEALLGQLPREPTEGKEWHVCVVYLAPGDYHRFHSPTEWSITSRRHFAGELFSVSKKMLKMLPNLFALNERVVLLGEWAHGFFSMVPVGAVNVGSIVVNCDKVISP
jgi:phosphatidylserine decarboxylase